jgi:mono/diheme cytochrome c family protein
MLRKAVPRHLRRDAAAMPHQGGFAMQGLRWIGRERPGFTARRGRLFAMALLAAGLAGVAPPPAAASDADRGRAIATEHCSGCHAIGRDAASVRPEAPPLRQVLVRVTPARLSAMLAQGLSQDHPAMPPLRLTPGEITALVGYVEGLQAR